MRLKITGTVFSIARASLHDGPGVRTVVYFKGCTLRCAWCHNPEGIAFGPELFYRPEKCVGCGRCIELCPACHSAPVEGGAAVFFRTFCRGCGVCAVACPPEALELCGKTYDAETLLAEIEKDRPYFEFSGGGVTLSGGECLAQPDFAAGLLERYRDSGIDTAIETALFVPPEAVRKVLPFTDTVIADLKCMDGETHRKYTGADNALILGNIRLVSNIHNNVWIRIPLIPGVGDGEDNLAASADFIALCGGGIKRVELLRYNNLASGKYTGLGKEYAAFAAEPQNDGEMEAKAAFMRDRLKKIPVDYR